MGFGCSELVHGRENLRAKPLTAQGQSRWILILGNFRRGPTGPVW